jgi:formate-dependent nitrite reductase membrane component NrfD
MPPSATFFTQPPSWHWLVVFYFFFGGISAGSFVFAAMLDLFGRPSDRPMARLGYLVSFPALLLCPPLLILDLSRPERFWHMMVQNHTFAPMFKPWSPMSIGSWALMVFGVFVTVAFVGALADVRPSGIFRRFAFLGRGATAKAIAALGVIPGFFVAGYTGVLLSVSNQRVWADTPMLGALFLLSAASTAAALLIWLGRGRANPASVSWLARMDAWVSILEIIAIIALLVTLGPVARVFISGWGVLIGLSLVLLGLLVPLLVHYRPRLLGANTLTVACAVAVASGLLLRIVIILSAQDA